MKEHIYEVRGNDGMVRRGIITFPSKKSNNIGIVLLPSGLKYRIGSHRFNVWLARELSNDGNIVLRFDPLGLGESDGSIMNGSVKEIGRTIEEGRFIEDVVMVCDKFKRDYKLKYLVAGGICGGAITSQMSAAKKPELFDGIVSIGTAVTVSKINGESITLTKNTIVNNLKSYVMKLFAGEAWLRLIRRESDISAIVTTIKSALKSGLNFKKKNEINYENENIKFIETFNTLKKNKIKHLLLFGGNDKRWYEFEDIILNRYLGNETIGDHYEVVIIPNANHELYLKDWQIQAKNKIRQWLQQNLIKSN